MQLDFLGTRERTDRCGLLTASAADQRRHVVLMGWVNRRRDHGSLIFLDVRDRTGITQVVLDKESAPEAHTKAEHVRPEFVVAVTGYVRRRDAASVNPKMPTGEVEVVAEELLVLNDSKVPPFSPAEDAIANEEVRLKYRYLDLRREAMQRNIELRHKVALAIRQYLSGEGFLEIETPFLTRSTPEGARDYLVPSRVHQGSFYALPQSPQLFKQILMISGFDRYFQIVRCFRDEDLRADRQPEFTQIDLEMSFPQQETVFAVAEGFLKAAFAVAGVELQTPFPRMTYDQAIRSYGIDKPDMRLPAIDDLTQILTPELRERLKIAVASADGIPLPVLGFVIPNAADGMSGTARRALVDEVRTVLGVNAPASGGLDFLDTARLAKADEFSSVTKEIQTALAATLPNATLSEGDLQIVITPKPGTPTTHDHDPLWIYKRVGALRLELARKYADKHRAFEKTGTAEDFRFLWVTDFPMFEWDDEDQRWMAAHHPFTSPHEDDLKTGRLTSDPGAVRALAYDVVLNGTELGSGSIRIHRQDVQAEIFRALGMTDEEARARFGFFLEALEYGTPPHGGIALGLDRIAMILTGATSLREVIAFPKTAKAMDLMVDAPTPVGEQQLKDLSLRVAPPAKK